MSAGRESCPHSDNLSLSLGTIGHHGESPPFGLGRGVRFKRITDCLAAVLLLFLTAPLLLLSMLLVKLTSRGPAIYSQIRLGLHGRPFTIFKVRSMAHECESLTGALWSIPGDMRVTRLGKWLRKTHIDELPQLWNVLRGDMSLVGPRPERPEFVPQLEQAIPHYRERLLVRPGVTGLAQVQLPPDTDLASVRTKLAYDLYYVANPGCWFDSRLCWATALKMVGVPFRGIRWVFALPRPESVANDYSKRTSPQPPRSGHAPKGDDNLSDAEPVPVLS
jgi:lipopolysaccharide/colanic/teichoic acid biosynthesis glycosyltransferase